MRVYLTLPAETFKTITEFADLAVGILGTVKKISAGA